ncbi:hypothetical protein TWF718_001748 [Orbilia javanica]|uniref:Uncharacterized protein n=1 Tax=Orbilia javanica TaxID=47235 RepID=A0AAN8N929_9PEZI
MASRIPITHLRPRKCRFQQARFNSTSTWKAASEKQGRPLIRYLRRRDHVVDQFHYHFTIPGNEPPKNTRAPNTPSNVTTVGETPRITLVYPNGNGPTIDYTTGGGGDGSLELRMRSVKMGQKIPRKSGALTGLEIAGVKALTLPVFEGPSNTIHLNEFLKKYQPSAVSYKSINGGWIFVKQDNSNPGYPMSKPDAYACEVKSRELLEKAIERFRTYDSSQAEYTSQAAGQEKKPVPYLFERVFKSSAQELRDLAVKHNYTRGGWFIYCPSGQVDKIFSDLSKSLISGELGRTSAHSVKVTASDSPKVPHNVHIVSVIVSDAWDKEANKKVLDVLLYMHGLTPQGCKPELFVQLGYGHLHKSKEDSCTFTPKDYYTKDEVSEAKFAFGKEYTFQREKILGNRLKSGLIDIPAAWNKTSKAAN